MQHGSSRQTELFADAVSYLGPAYLYDLSFFALRLPLFYSFDKLIVTQVSLVYDLVQFIAMPIRDPVQHKAAIPGNRVRAAFSPLRQHLIYRDPALPVPRQVRTMTASSVFAGIADNFAPHWIEMQISYQLQKITLFVAQNRFVSALK